MKDFLKKHNIKRVNIFWFFSSLVFSAIFALILSLISKKWCNFISDTLSLTALPSLFISCLVLTNIDDVRKQIKSEEESRDFFDRRKNQALSIFVRDYEDNFKTNSKSLRDDLKKIILGESDFSEEFNKRIRKISLECFQSLEIYSYVETRINIRGAQKTEAFADETQRSLDIDLNILSNLKASLRNCYNLDNENFKKPEFCEDLSKYLNDFDNFCDFLIKESKGDGMISDEHVGKDSEASQGMGDFYE
ncbi:hypothetical protein [Streptococcus sanguinis]|uniref:hypothetical protein n=1 Tax=Streptococcus sanguinis TaxID=1305 RepID=UPI000F6734FC|nr:hypothetical protein [Streptococcus sanguinis]RSI35477.1 hypothetical protein D8876_06500 [Streptococcus sanguinis]